MSEENKIRDAADAVKGLVEAVPIYQDVVQPAAKELGSALQTVAKTVHVALAPVSGLIWGFEQIREWLQKRDQLFQDLSALSFSRAYFRWQGLAEISYFGNYLLDTRLTVYLGTQTEMAEELSQQLTNCVK